MVVVLGEHRDSYLKEIPALLNCELLYNDKIDLGPFYSLRLALEFLKDEKAVFLLPMDTPGANPSVWKTLTRSHQGNEWVSIPTFNERGGHPIILNQSFFQTILDVNLESEEARLDLQIKKLTQEKVKRIPVKDSRIKLNINSL